MQALEKINSNGASYVRGFHTQEARYHRLSFPAKCISKDAWLGEGYYFWTELRFAEYWGESSKNRYTGAYEIYEAWIPLDNLLNAVFDEEGYNFFVSCIEKVTSALEEVHGNVVPIDQVHRYLYDFFWQENNIEGIIYSDTPHNPYRGPQRYSNILLNEGKNQFFYFRKRIQIVIFESKKIKEFKLFQNI